MTEDTTLTPDDSPSPDLTGRVAVVTGGGGGGSDER